MGFTTGTFLFIFLPASILLYLLIGLSKSQKAINIYLTIVSLAFYLWGSPKTVIFIIAIILLIWAFGKLIERVKDKSKRKFLAIATVLLVLVLAFYKYYSFAIIEKVFEKILGDLAGGFIESIIVPLGVSFVVFNAISYVVDVYRGKVAAGTIIEAALFISFFPKLISGPIVRWEEFKPQISKRKFEIEMASDGLDRIIIGLAKKVIIADTLGQAILSINEAIPIGVPTSAYWLKFFFYAFQLYYDFAGYSDIAIGISKIFGFDFSDNFNYPYSSVTIGEFWRRWHISLGAWFREYVYIPLGGNRKGNVYIHLMIVFLLTEIWHGAGLNYIAWGLMHGVCIIIDRFLSNKTKFYVKIPGVIKWLLTMVIVFGGWLLFMNPGLRTTLDYIKIMLTGVKESPRFYLMYFLNLKTTIAFAFAILGSLVGRIKFMSTLACKIKDNGVINLIKKILLLVLLVIAMIFIVNQSYSPFMYFQF